MAEGQVTIKERVVISPANRIDSSSLKDLKQRQALSVQDTSLTIVTVSYYYHGCEGNASIWTTSSPCQAYHDTAIGPPLSTSNRRRVATFQFVAYDQGHYEFGGATA